MFGLIGAIVKLMVILTVGVFIVGFHLLKYFVIAVVLVTAALLALPPSARATALRLAGSAHG